MGSFGSPWFRERGGGGGVCWLCLLCWYFDIHSMLFLDFLSAKVVLQVLYFKILF